MNRLATPFGVALAIGLSACGGSGPQPAPGTTSTTATTSEASAKAVEQAPPPPPALGVYVTNEASGDLTIIDAASQCVPSMRARQLSGLVVQPP